jgi:hypothetical protein
MRRYVQSLPEILASLSRIDASWRDAHAEAVIQAVSALPQKAQYTADDIRTLLERDFIAALTVAQLALDVSKDEFRDILATALGPGGIGIKRYRKDADAFILGLSQIGLLEKLGLLANSPASWRDLLIERLKTGRGSAIKGQSRGRSLEDLTERIVKGVFSDIGYDTRCRFLGAGGTSTEKADFAIPSKQEPRILIEAKAYGATGSKQTDILGDISRIVQQKRHDTHLLLVTDGSTWRARLNDLRKLIQLQNTGQIARIYTQSMANELEADLVQLRLDHAL